MALMRRRGTDGVPLTCSRWILSCSKPLRSSSSTAAPTRALMTRGFHWVYTMPTRWLRAAGFTAAATARPLTPSGAAEAEDIAQQAEKLEGAEEMG